MSRFVLTLLVAILTGSCLQAPSNSNVNIPQLEPGNGPPSVPEVVGPGIISTGYGERDATFMPDYSAFYYTLWTGRSGIILQVARQDNGWSAPTVAPFSGRYSDLEPFVTSDGARLYFASNRPADSEGEIKDYDIWYVEREDTGWGSPIRLGENVNSSVNEFYPSLDDEGTLYFTAAYEHSIGGEDIWMSRQLDGTFAPAVNVGPGVNTEKDEFNALIAPDGSWLAFSSFGRNDDLGGGDLYLSFREPGGALGVGVNAGAPINSTTLDFSPALSPDRQTFFFSTRRSTIAAPRDTAWTYTGIDAALRSYGNGNLDILCISASFIDDLRNRR